MDWQLGADVSRIDMADIGSQSQQQVLISLDLENLHQIGGDFRSPIKMGWRTVISPILHGLNEALF